MATRYCARVTEFQWYAGPSDAILVKVVTSNAIQNSNVGRWHVLKTRLFCQISAFALTILDGDERRTLRGRYAPEEHLKGPSIEYLWVEFFCP